MLVIKTDSMGHSTFPKNVSVLSPNGGEVWVIGETKDITWISEYILNVKIELSIDNGETWSTIISSTPSNGNYSWIVNSLTPSNECLVKISEAADSSTYDESDTTFVISKISEVDELFNNSLPTEFSLFSNYPNPFNPTTVIEYSLPKYGFVTLKIYDMLGREIATLVNEEKPAGRYEVEFNSHSGEVRNLPAGRQGLPSGIYFYQLRAGTFVQANKMVLLR